MPASQQSVTGRKLLVINPNTNPEVTAKVRLAAQEFAGAQTRIDAINPVEGPFGIETSQDRAAAIPQVVSLVRQARSLAYDGYILACFDDIAIPEVRSFVTEPVISMAEAGIRKAALTHPRFGVVTTVEAAVPTIAALAESYQMAGRYVVRATGIGVAETAAQTQKAEAALHDVIVRLREFDGVGAILLGSGAFAGRSEGLARQFDMPFIDGLHASISHCLK